MANFLDNLFERLVRAANQVVLREIRGEQFVEVTGRELLDQVARVRGSLRELGLHPGERCALLGPNSIQWAALDIALMAEGLVVVPLYSRLAAADLVGMMKDCGPLVLFANDSSFADAVAHAWAEAPRRILFAELWEKSQSAPAVPGGPNARTDSDLVTIIYTSGTSGEPKGV
ncbi:MAG TPA: AMP-binding protein, partial [Candidatus Sulfotelmatobacter sp.]|nr:AMP-binding protein [Candidatus Sulfotelmatobacter sp.]